MRDTNSQDERGNLERIGENAGAMAGKAADFGVEVSGALFRSAADMLGGWWSSDAPRQAASAWTDSAERDCRSHYAAGGGGATQATRPSEKSTHAAMQVDDQGIGGEAQVGDARMSGSVQRGNGGVGGEATFDSAGDGFERARPGYQLGWVAKQNPAYRDRDFSAVEPDLRRVWESRSRSERDAGGAAESWNDVRGFVDFAYQQPDDERR